MEETLTLNNGTVLSGHLIETGGNLFLYINDTDFADVFDLLNNPENVVSIEWKRPGGIGYANGYKYLHSIAKESATLVTAMLRKWDYDV